MSEQGILCPCSVPHDVLDSLHVIWRPCSVCHDVPDSLHVSWAGLPQGQLVLTMSGNPLHRRGRAPTWAQCLTHGGWGAKSADRSSSQGVRENSDCVGSTCTAIHQWNLFVLFMWSPSGETDSLLPREAAVV